MRGPGSSTSLPPWTPEPNTPVQVGIAKASHTHTGFRTGLNLQLKLGLMHSISHQHHHYRLPKGKDGNRGRHGVCGSSLHATHPSTDTRRGTRSGAQGRAGNLWAPQR